MKIGLYFGSFNPIHTGHLIIAEHIISHTDLKQIWFIVSPQNPFKEKSGLLNEYDRLHFVNISIEDNPDLRSNDVEFKLPKPSYTSVTLAYLKEKHPQHQFSIVIGSDSFMNLPKWKNFEYLITETDFIVYERPDFLIDENKTDEKINYRVLKNAPLLDISATYIRKCIKEKKSIRYLVHDKLLSELEINRYYL